MITRFVFYELGLSCSGIIDSKIIDGIPETADNMILPHRSRKSRLQQQAVIFREHTQKVFRSSQPIPRGSTSEPAVLALARLGGILAGHHLAIHIRLHLAQRLVLHASS